MQDPDRTSHESLKADIKNSVKWTGLESFRANKVILHCYARKDSELSSENTVQGSDQPGNLDG